MYILDTSVLSALRRSDRVPQMRDWLTTKADNTLFLSVITIGKIQREIGHLKRVNPDLAGDRQIWLDRTLLFFKDRLVSFGAEDARRWGELSADKGLAGDRLMIAATALVHGATVVTDNSTGFAAIGVQVENPF